MPKLKTHKASAKRFRITRTGKVVARFANIGQHLMRRKSKRVRRKRGRLFTLSPADARRIKQALPYGSR